MMKLINLGETFGVTMLTGILVLALSNCEQGPADQAGRNIDDPTDTIADQIERTGNYAKVSPRLISFIIYPLLVWRP